MRIGRVARELCRRTALAIWRGEATLAGGHHTIGAELGKSVTDLTIYVVQYGRSRSCSIDNGCRLANDTVQTPTPDMPLDVWVTLYPNLDEPSFKAAREAFQVRFCSFD